MATQSLLYSSLTAMVLTGASLANLASRQGTTVDNSVNLYIDVSLSGNITTGAAASTGNCYLLVAGKDGTNWDYLVTGTDAAITLPTQAITSMGSLTTVGQQVPGTMLKYLTTLYTEGTAAGVTYSFGPIYIAQAFGGNMPLGGWTLILCNYSGQSLSATATVLNYVGLKYTIA